MANIKTPDGGFYVDDTEFDVDYVNNVVTLAGSAGPGGNYLPLAGGTMDVDAVIEGTDSIEMSVGDTTQSAVVGVTQTGVTIEHNINSEADSSIRAIVNAIELEANSTTVTINGTGMNMSGAAISGINSLAGQASTEIAIESNLDMNNHTISGLPTVTVADATGADDVVTQLNALLTQLRAAGIIPNS